MKISYLHIRNYKQFSDLELDLTYPKGHKKAGQPLDKICIIGQSGTGKTNLLDIIKKSTIDFDTKMDYIPFQSFLGNHTDDKYITTKYVTKEKNNIETLFTTKKSILKMEVYNRMREHEKVYFVGAYKIGNQIIDTQSFDNNKMSSSDKRLLDALKRQRGSIEKSGIGYAGGIDAFETKIKNIDDIIKEIKNKYIISEAINQIKSKNFIQRSIININDEIDSLWTIMKEKINNYQGERSKYIDSLSNKILTDETYDKQHFKTDVKVWENENENLLEEIAEDINFILKKFNLELTKIDENQQNYNGLIIKDLSNDSIIDYDDLSTGTKNLLFTFIPLKTHAPKDSIILIDEPEMSFYPDIQRQLTDLYMNVGTNNQLVMATHSPLIASSFEPWEVVELKFDKNNQIYRENYYDDKNENHVDNYTVDPRYLTWTSILTDVFDLKEDSNFSFREQGLMEYATLKEEIKAIQDKKSKEAKVKIERFKKLSQKLGLQN